MQFSYLCWNVAGFNSKMNYMLERIKYFTVNGFIETWVDCSMSDKINKLTGYQFDIFEQPALRKYRYGRSSGGLMLLCKKSTEYSCTLILKSQHWIFVSVDFYDNTDSFIVGLIYIQPVN